MVETSTVMFQEYDNFGNVVDTKFKEYIICLKCKKVKSNNTELKKIEPNDICVCLTPGDKKYINQASRYLTKHFGDKAGLVRYDKRDNEVRVLAGILKRNYAKGQNNES